VCPGPLYKTPCRPKGLWMLASSAWRAAALRIYLRCWVQWPCAYWWGGFVPCYRWAEQLHTLRNKSHVCVMSICVGHTQPDNALFHTLYVIMGWRFSVGVNSLTFKNVGGHCSSVSVSPMRDRMYSRVCTRKPSSTRLRYTHSRIRLSLASISPFMLRVARASPCVRHIAACSQLLRSFNTDISWRLILC
jgi:hypothetical protein